MAVAYVLITSEVGAETPVLKDLGAIPEIKEAHTVHGLYDIIARVETNSMVELKEAVNYKIRSIEKIRSTITMIAN
jgi:DNA-binding Lrp family transcriptional regulator